MPGASLGTTSPILKEVYDMPGVDMSSIKNPKVYERLKKKGMSKMKAAKISNSLMKKIYNKGQ